jgi:hypothetical protein
MDGGGLIPLYTLKKADRTISRNFRAVRMDIDDFYAIVQLLEDNHCEGLKLQVDGYILDDPKQIERLPKSRTSQLTITTSKPYLQLNLRRWNAGVYVGEDSMLAEGLVSSFAQILDGYAFVRQLGRVFWPLNILWWLGLVVSLRDPHLIPISVQNAFEVVYIPIGLVVCLSWWRGHFIFYFRRKHDSFLKRNKDRIEKLVFLLVGAGLTLVVELILKKATTP